MYEWMYAKKVKNEQLMRLRQAPSLSTKVDLEGLDVSVTFCAEPPTILLRTKTTPLLRRGLFVRKAREKKSPSESCRCRCDVVTWNEAGKPCSDSFRCRPGSLARWAFRWLRGVACRRQLTHSHTHTLSLLSFIINHSSSLFLLLLTSFRLEGSLFLGWNRTWMTRWFCFNVENEEESPFGLEKKVVMVYPCWRAWS